MGDGEIETHRHVFRLDEQPRNLDLQSADHRSSIHVELTGCALHATLVGSESAELDLNLQIEDASGTGIEAWGVATARDAEVIILHPSGEERAARLCGIFGAGGGPRMLRPGCYMLRASVVQGTIMIRLGLDGEHKRLS